MSKEFYSPFSLEPDKEVEDNQLIERVLSGEKNALETLLTRHQPWIYNIAFRMVLTHEDAEDVTQEILIKIITKLSTFKPEKAAFRTWLYRIVINHVINMKTRNYESSIPSLENYYSYLHQVPDEEPEDTPEMKIMITDLGIGCTEGVLLCLNRKQRVVFILAVVFNVTDVQGSEILEISKDNFRKILSRARAKLHQYMNSNCGVINQNSPCKCRNKVKGFIKSGALSPDVITFAQVGSPKIKDVISQKAAQFQESIYSQYMKVFQDHPFYKAPDITGWFRNLLDSAEFKQIFQLD